MDEKELKDRMQYWYSKACNAIMRPDKEAYLGVYNALKAVYDLKFKKNPAGNSCLDFSKTTNQSAYPTISNINLHLFQSRGNIS